MSRAIPTTAQAERIHRLVDEVVAQHPRDTELLRGLGRAIVQQPDDSGPGLPEPVEPRVQQMMATALEQGPVGKLKMRRALPEA